MDRSGQVDVSPSWHTSIVVMLHRRHIYIIIFTELYQNSPDQQWGVVYGPLKASEITENYRPLGIGLQCLYLWLRPLSLLILLIVFVVNKLYLSLALSTVSWGWFEVCVEPNVHAYLSYGCCQLVPQEISPKTFRKSRPASTCSIYHPAYNVLCWTMNYCAVVRSADTSNITVYWSIMLNRMCALLMTRLK